MNIALIMAGGSGSRMKNNIPKQFLIINNKPIIIYTIEKFENNINIDKVVIVCKKGWCDVLNNYLKEYDITKIDTIIEGGNDRQESIKNGLDYIKKNYKLSDILLIHDAARPLVSDNVIDDSIKVCKKNRISITAIDVVDTMVYTEDKIKSNKIINRDNLIRIQTPETAVIKDLVESFEEAKSKNILSATSISNLYLELGKEIYFSKGERINIKITTQEDLKIFEALI